MNIPIYIICFNNGFYVENTIIQLKNKNISDNNIIIINNNSTGLNTVAILKKLENSYKIINFEKNYGHRVWNKPIIWNNLPEHFIITDPDLEYNEKLPNNFIDILYEISTKYNASKVGFALDITSSDIFNDNYVDDINIKEWEMQFWKKPLEKYNNLDIYDADIDTTFFLGCKSKLSNGFSTKINIRVASNFICKHLPWHINHNDSLDKTILLEMYLNDNNISTTSKIIKKYYNF